MIRTTVPTSKRCSYTWRGILRIIWNEEMTGTFDSALRSASALLVLRSFRMLAIGRIRMRPHLDSLARSFRGSGSAQVRRWDNETETYWARKRKGRYCQELLIAPKPDSKPRILCQGRLSGRGPLSWYLRMRVLLAAVCRRGQRGREWWEWDWIRHADQVGFWNRI